MKTDIQERQELERHNTDNDFSRAPKVISDEQKQRA